jgi:hypothetical protein
MAKQLKFTLLQARILSVIAMGAGPGLSVAAATAFSDTNWTQLGSGMNNTVYALAVSGTNLYAGGKFTMAGGNAASYIAKWDGNSWSALGSGMNGYVYTLAVSGTNLYAGGEFTTAGGNNANLIAKWDGHNWSSLGTGIKGYYVQALAISGTNLYAGGNFSQAGNWTAYCLAQWNGRSWTALGSGMDNTVYALAASDSGLYAGGDFIKAGYNTVHYIAKWDWYWFNWSALGSGMGNSDINSVYALAIWSTNLYAGGLFSSAGGRAASSIAKWDGNSWTGIGSLGKTNSYPSVNALAILGSDLYAGGYFTTAGSNPFNYGTVNYIAKWDGSTWSALGSGMNNTVHALAVSGNDLYVGGEFTTAGNQASAFIARAHLPALPALSVLRSGAQVTISWPSADTAGFFLEQADTLAAPINWVSNTANATDDGTNTSVTIPATNAFQFFRLHRP